MMLILRCVDTCSHEVHLLAEVTSTQVHQGRLGGNSGLKVGRKVSTGNAVLAYVHCSFSYRS